MYEHQKIEDWERDVEDQTDEQLKKFLLVREETPLAPEGFVRVNFDPILTRLLREVRYLQLLDIKVPERAKNLFAKCDVYRKQTGNLDIIVDMYNDIISTLLPGRGWQEVLREDKQWRGGGQAWRGRWLGGCLQSCCENAIRVP